MDNIGVPVIIGLAVGVTFIVLFASQTNSAAPIFPPPEAAKALPEVSLVVTDEVNRVSNYAGERGSYCWSNGCGDTGILIPGEITEIKRDSLIQFEYLDDFHNNRQPDELGVIAYEMERLEVIGSVGNVQLAAYDTNSDRQFLKDRGNHKYVITMAAGDYVLGAHSAWYYKGNLNLSDGDVVFYYRISVTD